MRIVWLTKGLGRGGAERLIVDSAGLYDRADVELHVAYLLPWKSDLAAEAALNGATVTCLGKGPRAVLWPLALVRFLRQHRFDVVHTHAPLPAAIARVVDRNAKFVHTEHNMWDRYRLPTRIVNALTYRRNTKVIAVSESVAQSIGSKWLRPGTKPEVVIHGIPTGRTDSDFNSRSRVRTELGVAPDTFVVGTVGNFTAKKDHATLLRAFATLVASEPDSHLVMVGSGPLESETHRLAESLGVRNQTSFLGKRSDVPAILRALDAFTLSSRFEGLPIALLEAMAAGLPIAATNVGGIPEAITHEVTGLLVEGGDVESLAAALARLKDDTALSHRISSAALEASSTFDLAAAVDTMNSMYMEVVGQ